MAEPPPQPSHASGAAGLRRKAGAYLEVLRRIRGGGAEAGASAGFEHELWCHFLSLPARYALDVNIERTVDVLLHKRLLEQAREPMNGLVFDVRPSQIATVDGITEVASSISIKQEEQDPRSSSFASTGQRALYEVVFAFNDKPKLLSQHSLVANSMCNKAYLQILEKPAVQND